MAHETLIHRFYVELAAGLRGSADTAFATDGVDDLYMDTDRKLSLRPFEGPVGVIEFIASNIDGARLVSLNENKLTTLAPESSADVTVTAPTNELFSLAGNRGRFVTSKVDDDRNLTKASPEIV